MKLHIKTSTDERNYVDKTGLVNCTNGKKSYKKTEMGDAHFSKYAGTNM